MQSGQSRKITEQQFSLSILQTKGQRKEQICDNILNRLAKNPMCLNQRLTESVAQAQENKSKQKIGLTRRELDRD